MILNQTLVLCLYLIVVGAKMDWQELCGKGGCDCSSECWGDGKCDPFLDDPEHCYDNDDCKNGLPACTNLDCCDEDKCQNLTLILTNLFSCSQFAG